MASVSVGTLNGLLNGELHHVHLYWQASAWCVGNHLDGCAGFLRDHADDELSHMKRVFDFMIDSEMSITFAPLPEPKVEADDVLGLFQAMLTHEGEVTDSVGNAVSEALDAGDHSAFEFLQWFVREQRRELRLFRQIVDRIKLIGDGPQALFFVDREIVDLGGNAD
ncbi:MAG: ferritin [Pseudomonadota bacterium]